MPLSSAFDSVLLIRILFPTLNFLVWFGLILVWVGSFAGLGFFVRWLVLVLLGWGDDFVWIFFVGLGWGFFATLNFGTHDTELLVRIPKGLITEEVSKVFCVYQSLCRL